MPRFAANLSLLFNEVELIHRFHAAGEYGFQAVEIQFPYVLEAEVIRDLLEENRLKLVLFNVDADDLLQGGEGLSAVPEKRSRFREAVAQTVEYAQILKPEVINVLPGRSHYKKNEKNICKPSSKTWLSHWTLSARWASRPFLKL